MASLEPSQAPAPAAPAAAPDPAKAGKGALCFMDLPIEVQKEIFAHCSTADLICLSLVSHHCRELAAINLYRCFDFTFPDDEEYDNTSTDSLAQGLETLVTSEYDYACHLKQVSLDTPDAGVKAESSYRPYLYNNSCGRFMNTLLLMTLRKAKGLESFRWNVRVELSRQVYQALHRINTLNGVHIRMQAGPSLFEAPPPLPLSAQTPNASTNPPSPPVHMVEVVLPPLASIPPPSVPPPYQSLSPPSPASVPPLPNPFNPFSLPPPPPPPAALVSLSPPPGPGNIFYPPPGGAETTSTNLPNYSTFGTPPPVAKPAASKANKAAKKAPALAKEPPTLSGFKQLKDLAVLDIDTLDYINEIKSCVRNSSRTLTKLKLSFSVSLANQARKPAPELEPEDSDVDDEFQVASPSSHDEASGPAKAFRAQEEKKSQEAVLGRIFEVESVQSKKPQKKTQDKDKDKDKGKDADAKEGVEPTAGRDFINALRAVSNKLMKNLSGKGSLSESQQEILDMIENAARMYVASDEAKAKGASKKADGKKTGSGPDSTDASKDSKATDKDDATADDSSSPVSAALTSASPIHAKKKDKTEVDPEDIDIVAPEEELQMDQETDSPSKETAATDDETPPEDTASSQEALTNGHAAALSSDEASADAEAVSKPEQLTEASNQPTKEKEEAPATESGGDDKNAPTSEPEESKVLVNGDSTEKLERQKMDEYLRDTRGLQLEELAIYLIPVKASVLSRAINLHTLKSLTLLNVGVQGSIWALLERENKDSALPLRRIYTDNVSPVFLRFIAGLQEVHDLFMLEREAKYKPESFAPKTTVTAEQIRRLVLRKHLPRIRRMVIRNNRDESWDLDEKTIMLLCRKAQVLEELTCNMTMKSMHTFMQYLSSLANLRALQVVHLRNEDVCVWVMHETKRFLLDNISHHPEMKIEYLSVNEEDRVERIIRRKPVDRQNVAKDCEERRKAKKGKGKQKAVGGSPPPPPPPPVADGNDAGSNAVSPTPAVDDDDVFPVLPSVDSWNDEPSDTDGEELDGYDSSSPGGYPPKDRNRHLKIETQDNLRFSDIKGVRIFEKDIAKGRL